MRIDADDVYKKITRDESNGDDETKQKTETGTDDED
jgi:hypothetical protein